MTTTTTARRSLTEILAEGHILPLTYDTWGWKVVRPDLRTRDGYRWPWPGSTVTCPDPAPASEGVCAAGLHIALTPAAIRSVAYGCSAVLLLAYRQADVITSGGGKCRVSRAYVADVIDLQAMIRTHGKDVDLRGADLTHAYLMGADLRDADLTRAALTGADLRGADLTDADLEGADLRGAVLTGAVLTGADLEGAILTGAQIREVQLSTAQRSLISGTPAWITGGWL